MSNLTRDNVIKVAHLARLSIKEEEIGSHVRNLSNILELVEQMNDIDTSGIMAMAHPFDIGQRMRPDEVTEENKRDDLQQCVADESLVKSGLYIVPKAYD